MKAFVGSHFIYKQPAGSDKKYIAYQIVDYDGGDHFLIEEEGWTSASKDLAFQEKSVVIHSGAVSNNKTSVIEIGKFIDDRQNDEIWFFSHENEIKKKLIDLSNDFYSCFKNEEYEEWIKSLTGEIYEI